MIKNPPQSPLHSAIQKAATGPGYSKDLAREEAYAAFAAILDGEADLTQAAVLLIALRMKRESDDENAAALQALLDRIELSSIDVTLLIDIADPYDGHGRGLPMTPFLPAVLAACGIPAIIHGLESIGPKYGITAHQVLMAAGVNVFESVSKVVEKIQNPSIGWGYVDQKIYSPALHHLLPLRNKMIKRNLFTTIENLCSPLRGALKTHLHTGYVHRNYPDVYNQLARQAGFSSATIVRGVEGGVIPSLQKEAVCHYYENLSAPLKTVSLPPTDIGIEQTVRAVLFEHETDNLPQKTLATGWTALNGERGPAYDSLVYGAAIALWGSQHSETIEAGAERAREALDSGQAMAAFKAAQET